MAELRAIEGRTLPAEMRQDIVALAEEDSTALGPQALRRAFGVLRRQIDPDPRQSWADALEVERQYARPLPRMSDG